MLFAGTTEGRKLCEYLTGKNCDTYVYVTTEYGRELLPQADNVHIHTGRMDEADMLKELEAKKPYIVIDATHPYATQVTHNIKNVCDSKNISYVRVLREDNDKKQGLKSDNITYVKSIKDVVELLNSEQHNSKNILMTTGSKNIPEYVYITDYKERVYLRLLPNPCMLQSAIEAGIMLSHLIGMQGPFSQELNEAVIRQFNIGVLVTKESGSNGGYEEKVSATENTGIDCIVIKRPVEENGVSLPELIKYLKTKGL